MSELLERARQILASRQGAEEIEVYLSRGTDTNVRVYEGAIEHLSSATSEGVGVRVLLDGPLGARVGCAWAGSLEETAVLNALAQARDNSTFASEGEFLAFARPDGVSPVSLQLTDPAVASTATTDKIEMAIELERLVRHGDPRIRQIKASNYSDYMAEMAIASTVGIGATYNRSGAHVSVEAIASDGRSDQTGWGLSVGRGPGDLNLNEAALDAITRSTRMLGAVKAASMKTTAVFDPRTAATLISIIGGALSGEAVQRGRSFFMNRLGELVASPLFTLLDDPTDPRHFGASPIDGEGLACRSNLLVDRGRLRAFVYDTVSARRAGTFSTGSAIRSGLASSPAAGCRALQLQSSTIDPIDLVRGVGTGLYVESLSGVHSGVNPVSGDFSVGVTGRMIRHGDFAEPVREVTVASTLPRMLFDLVGVASDVQWLPGNAAGQTIAIDDVAVSGS